MLYVTLNVAGIVPSELLFLEIYSYCFWGFASRKSFTIGTIVDMRAISVTSVVSGKMANLEAEYKKLSPTPDDFPKFVKRVLATASSGHDLGADKLKATKAPMFFIHGDADGVRLDHISEMFSLKGGGISGDMQSRSESRLAILPNTTHVTLMARMSTIVPMVNDFLDAKPQKQ